MPEPTFRGDPYRVLDVSPDASGADVKRRWRELAREHHPDRAAGDREEARRLTGRMARINAAYDLLRDPIRRARFDQTAEGRRSRSGVAGDRWSGGSGEPGDAVQGPPPAPPARPVTARFDTSTAYRPRNATLCGPAHRLPGHAPRSRREAERDELRASTPSGPVERRNVGAAVPPPTLREARETTLAFGKYGGYTLGEVELIEPTYIDWIAHTITRDRDLVLRARVIQSELDRQGVARRMRPTAAGFGNRAATG